MFVCEGHDFHDALPFSGRDFGSHYAAEVPLIRHSIPLLKFTLKLTFHSKLTFHFINESSFAKSMKSYNEYMNVILILHYVTSCYITLHYITFQT